MLRTNRRHKGNDRRHEKDKETFHFCKLYSNTNDHGDERLFRLTKYSCQQYVFVDDV